MPMLREGGRLTLSDFAKVAAHSGLLKARVRFSRAERFVVHADEKLTAFLELESAVCASDECLRESWSQTIRV